MGRPRAKIHSAATAEAMAGQRRCEIPGCLGAGEFRAPRGRERLNEFYWFCLDHVRAYNSAWDYYKGMTPEEIEAARRADIVGWRPTWPMGSRGRRGQPGSDELRDAFRRFFDEDVLGMQRDPPRPPRPSTPEEEALAVFDLSVGATQEEVKARYKTLVKIHHPDANGGDKAAEERLKSINRAYTVLKSQAQNGRTGVRE